MKAKKLLLSNLYSISFNIFFLLISINKQSSIQKFYERFPVTEIRNDVIESYKVIEENLGNKNFRAFAYPYGAYTNKTVWILKLSGIDMQVYDIGINNFKDLDKEYIKRINVPCEMTGKEIIEEIEKDN